MTRSRPTFARSFAVVTAAAVFGLTGLAACGSDSGGDDASDVTGSPEDIKAPMEEVLAKLPTISAAGAAAAAAATAGDFDTASAKYDELHEVWEEAEGTIKDTDPDAYEAIETAQGLINDGAENENADRVVQGASDQAAAIDSFIAANS
jgi:hypothetical protein